MPASLSAVDVALDGTVSVGLSTRNADRMRIGLSAVLGAY